MSTTSNVRTIKIDWSVKGYHHFKIRPHADIILDVIPEDGNRFDPFAMKVVMPTLDRIPSNLRSNVTREASQRHARPQTVAEIAGKQVGRVPANLCRAFREITARRLCTSLSCKYQGTVGQTRDPRPTQHFQRRFSPSSVTVLRDLPGGGAELHCSYLLLVTTENFERVMHILEQHVGVAVLDDRVFA